MINGKEKKGFNLQDTKCVDFYCCDEPKLGFRRGDKVCLNCGLVHGREFIATERKAYNQEEKDKRKQSEKPWRRFGPRTLIPSNSRELSTLSTSVRRKTLFRRLSKIQKSLITSLERNLWEAEPKLKLIAMRLNIPRYIRDTAWRIYLEVAKAQLTKGRSVDGFLSASIYSAIRIHKYPFILDHMADGLMISRHSIIKCLGKIVREVLPKMNLSYKPITPVELLHRFTNLLNLPFELYKSSRKILVESVDNGLSIMGKNPKSIAAGAIYVALEFSPYKLTQREIAETTNITEVTLRYTANAIKQHLNEISR